MPLYEYQCATCGPFTELRSMSERNAPIDCPQCAAASARMLSRPALRQISSGSYQAHTRNERSAHEPLSLRRVPPPATGHAHGPGCGHADHRGKRPWMLGH
ncbi:FmdB family zinc ribbon protein [Candidatus Macondimonas diazotrophica]|uniref:Zinc ribbon domain-containing protein n=1 Tax=Candidatus Macondimonas diazotrophica TaxID=2305248 RepID=A0A4Z0FAI3_9GAMM|nr:zinc ribbon domain-containing protein [Candidatus Macondimonas diazotrophica]NCU01208.1 zinc ribbon domain-containing protein [Candidatus Macondimonas diazotrophica]TFZ82858.1 zinc ribbon domain-containing protein [Candidatus Macondimonas diazotrophica]HBG30425.1 hypothetical protein [Gammaproteobacteria bacterium]HBG50589.1 hypothetical protein [Gammaproteobacteria bacterium]